MDYQAGSLSTSYLGLSFHICKMGAMSVPVSLSVARTSAGISFPPPPFSWKRKWGYRVKRGLGSPSDCGEMGAGRGGPAQLPDCVCGSLCSVPAPLESSAPLRASPLFSIPGTQRLPGSLGGIGPDGGRNPQEGGDAKGVRGSPWKHVGCCGGQSIPCILCLPPVQSPESPLPWVLPKPCRFPLAPSWLL